jgi:anti-sigma factor RsiW
MDPCGAFAERLSAFHDGELDPAAEAAVAEHLESCERCGARLAEIARLEDTAAAPAPAVAPDEWARCWDGIAAAIDEEPPSALVLQAGERAAWLVRRLIPIAASILVALAAYGWLASRGPEDVMADAAPRAFTGAAFAAAPGGL